METSKDDDDDDDGLWVKTLQPEMSGTW